MNRRFWLQREVLEIARLVGLKTRNGRSFDRRDIFYWKKAGVFPEPELWSGEAGDDQIWYANDQMDCGLLDIARRMGKDITQEDIDVAKIKLLATNKAMVITMLMNKVKEKPLE